MGAQRTLRVSVSAGRALLSALCLGLLVAAAQSLPVRASARGLLEAEESPQRSSFLAHEAEASKACNIALKSEEQLKDPKEAPESLIDAVAQGRWAYRQTNAGVKKHPLLSTDSGNFDLWVERASPLEGGTVSEVSSLVYVTSHAETTEGFMGSLTIRGEGYYDRASGLLCMLGCVDDERSGSYSWGGIVPAEVAEADAPEADYPSGEALSTGQDWVKTEGAPEIPRKSVCKIRIILRYRRDPAKSGDDAPVNVTGSIESLQASGEQHFFSALVVTASTGSVLNQIWLFQLEMLVEAGFLLLQALSLAYQILRTRREADGIYVSQTLVTVQFLVFGYYWIRSVYYPLRYMSVEVIMYLMSDMAQAPRFAEFLICTLCLAWGLSVDAKRRRTARFKGASTAGGLDVEALPFFGGSVAPPKRSRLSEKPFALGFWLVYLLISAVLWFTHGFENLLRVSQFMFLFPQICLNYIWDLPKSSLGAITLVYAVVTSLTQMAWLSYEVFRPRIMGYDAFFAFPHAWYWSGMLLMLAQLVVFLYQRLKGSRFGRLKPIVEGLQITPQENEHGV